MYRFTDDCLTGIEQIDDDHRQLFALINQTQDLLESQRIPDKYSLIKSTLAELLDYADRHFEREEAYMAAISDPELDFQKKQHVSFRDRINSFDRASISESSEQEQLLKDLMIFLTKWLYSHILSSDILIGKMPPLKDWLGKDNPCVFSDIYITGIPLVDREHEKLFAIIGEANALVQDEMAFDKYDEIVAIIQKLRNYTKEHFRDEEEYMESIGYEGLEAQKMAHAVFIQKLSEISFEHIDDNQQIYLEELMAFLFNWLANHILKSDKRIQPGSH